MITEEERRGIRTDYDLLLIHTVPPSLAFTDRMKLLVGVRRELEDLPAHHNPVEVIEGRLGLMVHEHVRAYIQGLRMDPHGNGEIFHQGRRVDRLPLGSNLFLSLEGEETNLYRTSRVRVGHQVGNPPLGPSEWFRNAEGILEMVSLIRAGERLDMVWK